jgi:hypothetical protein
MCALFLTSLFIVRELSWITSWEGEKINCFNNLFSVDVTLDDEWTDLIYRRVFTLFG